MNQVPQEVLNAYARDASYTQEHMDAIIEFARWAEPTGILDLGMHYGSSAIHFQNAFPDALVVTVGDELERGGWIAGDIDVVKGRCIQNGLEDKIIILNSDTRICGPGLDIAFAPPFKIGVVFHDACHDHHGLMHEHEQYKHLLAEKHCLILDDTTEGGNCSFAIEQMRRGYTIELGSTFKGLAVLKKGGEI